MDCSNENFMFHRQLAGSEWLTQDELMEHLLEKVDDRDYEQFKMAIERLAQHPYAYRVTDFIHKYRKALLSQTTKYEITKVQYDENGRAFVTTYGKLVKKFGPLIQFFAISHHI